MAGPLTRQQTRVLLLIAEGYTSKKIGELLNISKRTADFHVAGIYERLKVANKVLAIREATRLGLLPTQQKRP